MTILNEFHRVKSTDVAKLWIIPTFTVGATIVIYLDWIYSLKTQGPSDPASLALLQDTIEALKIMDFDFSSRRGVEMLEGLVSQKVAPGDGIWDDITTPDLEGLMAYLEENTVWEH